MGKIRLTVGQAIVRFMAAQYSERDGVQQRFIAGVWGIFGHGNVAGLGQALEELGDELELPFYRPQNEQAQVHLAAAFAKRRFNAYDEQYSDGGQYNPYRGAIVWVARERPFAADVAALGVQDTEFDSPGAPMRLETRLIFWFPLRVPFANWLMSRMWLAQYGLRAYTAQNPLLLTQRANWQARASGYALDTAIANEMLTRADRREYVFPVEASYTMRMMSPAKAANFATQHCAPTPAGLP